MDLALVILRGTHAARPDAATKPNGTLYYETDTLQSYLVVAGAWVAWIKGVV